MGLIVEGVQMAVARRAMLAGADLDGLAAAAAASTVLGGVFLALGRRRKPISSGQSPRLDIVVRDEATDIIIGNPPQLPRSRTWRMPHRRRP